jgi:hypothetical protein
MKYHSPVCQPLHTGHYERQPVRPGNGAGPGGPAYLVVVTTSGFDRQTPGS